MSKVFKLLIVFSLGFTGMYLRSGYMGAWWVTILLTTSFLGYFRTQTNNPRTNPALIWLGTICYGVYLIHPLVLGYFATGGALANWAFYLALAPVLLLASVSWILIEKPFSGIFRA
jgi:peptidoglycan/LPS O-acetylase OafA/YrhL